MTFHEGQVSPASDLEIGDRLDLPSLPFTCVPFTDIRLQRDIPFITLHRPVYNITYSVYNDGP